MEISQIREMLKEKEKVDSDEDIILDSTDKEESGCESDLEEKTVSKKRRKVELDIDTSNEKTTLKKRKSGSDKNSSVKKKTKIRQQKRDKNKERAYRIT